MNEMLEQTYVFKDGKVHWLVSTLNRESSAALAHGAIYAETMVFDLSAEPRTIAGQTEASEGSLRGHDKMVRRLRETGSPDEQEEDQP